MNKHVTLHEEALIESCIKGDRKSQKALYDFYGPRMFSACFKYTKNRMDAEDALQDGFVKLFINLQKFKGEGSFEGWMRRIFINTSIECIRRKKFDTKDCEVFENTLEDKQPNALSNLYNKDLLKTTNCLSKGYQTVFYLYAVEGFSHRQIAQQLGISENTSKSQFSRAKASLRSMVEARQSA